MGTHRLKYIFVIIAGLLLIIMQFMSSDAGISCDEVLHYDHSLAVCNFYATHGADRSALNTPETQLKYYGQSYDDIVTFLIKCFNIDDVYRFRHIMSPIAGWLAIMVTALFSIWLSGYRTGIIVLLLFAVSPTFLGHSQNNLKDIPFALGYISSIYFTFRFITSENSVSFKNILFLILSISFSISIRAGGLLLICYLFLFSILFVLYRIIITRSVDIRDLRRKALWIIIVSVSSWLFGIILWPYALLRPFTNVIESYHIMAHYPLTFRQIFEGRVEWSDFMPWYYLIKSMAITIPLVVLTGFLLIFVFSKRILKDSKGLLYLLLLFTVFFPIIFVIYEKSNLYSSWRQFLFVYPSIVLIAATGFSLLIDYAGKLRLVQWGIGLFFILMLVHPVKFMALNHKYSYIYYNQLIGGIRGANGNYETDYYYVSQTEASEWLKAYLNRKKDTGLIKVKATYSVSWLFRDNPRIVTSYFRNEERSLSDWDYAIVANRYIPPYQLKNKIWPPSNAIHVVYADRVPLCAVLERRTRDDLNGYEALNAGRTEDAVKYFREALKINNTDEMIFYNFAAALYNSGKICEADSALKAALALNPGFEPALMYLGNIAIAQNNNEDARCYFEKVISADRKYFEAYIKLADLFSEKDISKARDLLRTCLTMNPSFKPAVSALADTYRSTDPDIAGKYDELAKKLK